MALLIFRATALLLGFWAGALAGVAQADVAPLVTRAAAPLIGGTPTPLLGEAPAPSAASGGSLFAGTGAGLFAPLPPRARSAPPSTLSLSGQSPVGQLLSLIARVEAGRDGYDAVQHGARVRPTAPPTQMTLGDIYTWIDATPGQPHAIGRYQFIPPTLRRVAQIRGYGPSTPFTPAVQDSLALILLEDAGLRAFEGGTLPRERFMHNLARIWAGLPLPNGQSYYEGHAGNRAAMTWAEFSDGMSAIWGRS